MGAIRAKFESFKQPKQMKAPRGRAPKTVFGPSKSKPAFAMNMNRAFSDANRLLNAETRGQGKMALAVARTEKFGGRLDNAATIQDALDQLDEQADQLLSGLK